MLRRSLGTINKVSIHSGIHVFEPVSGIVKDYFLHWHWERLCNL